MRRFMIETAEISPGRSLIEIIGPRITMYQANPEYGVWVYSIYLYILCLSIYLSIYRPKKFEGMTMTLAVVFLEFLKVLFDELLSNCHCARMDRRQGAVCKSFRYGEVYKAQRRKYFNELRFV